MIPTVVAVPVKNHWDDYTWPLLDHLLGFELVERVVVFDNGSQDDTWNGLTTWAGSGETRLRAAHRPEATIYEMWNEAFRYALDAFPNGEVNLALLNNDIRLAPGTLAALSKALRSDEAWWAVSVDPTWRVEQGLALHPEPVEAFGTYRHGGLVGWAFMVKAENWRDVEHPVDPQFRWWGGDDDLVFSIAERGGKVARVRGVPCDHVGEGTAQDTGNEWVHAEKEQDRKRFEAKWGEGTGW